MDGAWEASLVRRLSRARERLSAPLQKSLLQKNTIDNSINDQGSAPLMCTALRNAAAALRRANGVQVGLDEARADAEKLADLVASARKEVEHNYLQLIEDRVDGAVIQITREFAHSAGLADNLLHAWSDKSRSGGGGTSGNTLGQEIMSQTQTLSETLPRLLTELRSILFPRGVDSEQSATVVVDAQTLARLAAKDKKQQNDEPRLAECASIVAAMRADSVSEQLRDFVGRLDALVSNLVVRFDNFLNKTWREAVHVDTPLSAKETLSLRFNMLVPAEERLSPPLVSDEQAQVLKWSIEVPEAFQVDAVAAVLAALRQFGELSKKLDRLGSFVGDFTSSLLQADFERRHRIAVSERHFSLELTVSRASSAGMHFDRHDTKTDDKQSDLAPIHCLAERMASITALLDFISRLLFGNQSEHVSELSQRCADALFDSLRVALLRSLPSSSTDLPEWTKIASDIAQKFDSNIARIGFGDKSVRHCVSALFETVLVDFDAHARELLLERAREMVATWEITQVHKNCRIALKSLKVEGPQGILWSARERCWPAVSRFSVSKSCTKFAEFILSSALVSDMGSQKSDHQHSLISDVVEIFDCVMHSVLLCGNSENVFLHVQLHNDLMFLSWTIARFAGVGSCSHCTARILSASTMTREQAELRMESAVEVTWRTLLEPLRECGDFSMAESQETKFGQLLARVRHQLEQVHRQVKSLVPKHFASSMVGLLFGRVLRQLTATILARSDIGAAESAAFFRLFTPFLALEHTLFSGTAAFPAVVDTATEPSWSRFVSCVEILDMSLVDIRQRAESGTFDGVLERPELTKLVRALFEQSVKRDSTIEVIQRRHG